MPLPGLKKKAAEVETGAFGKKTLNAKFVRPMAVYDTFGIAADATGEIGIFTVPTGTADPVLSTTKTKEDTNIKTANRLDFDFLALGAALIPDPQCTPDDIRSLCHRCRLELVVNINTRLIEMPLWPLLAPMFQGAYAIGDTNAAAGTAVTYTMRAVPGAGPFGPSGLKFAKDSHIVIAKGEPIDCKLIIKSSGSDLLEAVRTMQFQLLGMGQLPSGG